MPNKNNKTLKYIHRQKRIKFSFIFNADLESLIDKINTCQNNLKRSSTIKINKHAPSGYLLFRYCLFDAELD